MAHEYTANSGRAATSADLGRIQPGWTVYDSLDRPAGNIAEVEGGELHVDGRPEGLGFYRVPTSAVRSVEDGNVYLSIDSERSRREGGEAPMREMTGQSAPSSAGAGTSARSTSGSREIGGSSYTASGTPVGLGSNTPVGEEPDTFRTWDRSVSRSPWSRLGMLVPVGLWSAAAGAAGYVMWRRRQARRSRLARLRRSVAPVLAATSGRKSAWWLTPLAAATFDYTMRTARRRGAVGQLRPMLAESPNRWDRMRERLMTMDTSRLPSAMQNLPSAVRNLPSAMQPPRARPRFVPMLAIGAIGAWLAFRNRGRKAGNDAPRQLRDVMTTNVEVIRPDASVAEAASTMRRIGVGFLPVCDGRRLQGTLTDRDIVVRTIADGRDPQVTTIREAMSPDVVYAFDDESVDRAADLMRQHQIRRLAIVDRGKSLVGVVALGDLAVDTGDDRLSGATLERISEPSRPTR
jgi:CBS domain-containing protein